MLITYNQDLGDNIVVVVVGFDISANKLQALDEFHFIALMYTLYYGIHETFV